MISDFFTHLRDYIQLCIDDVMVRSPLGVFFLFAPALLFDTLRYYITNTIIFFIDFFKGETDGEEKEAEYLPFVSLVLPVYREGAELRLTIDSILESNYPNFELIVVDEGSEEETYQICRAYEEKGLIRYVRKAQRGGKPESLNYGLQLAAGEILMHLDGDVIIERNAIREAVKPFIDPKVGVVSGNLKVINDTESLAARLQAAEYGMCISVGRRWAALTDTLQIASGAFSCFRKEILSDLRGTDPEYGEDLDLTLKVRKLGFKVAFTPRAVARTYVPGTWFGLFKQRVRWDRCYIRLNLGKHRNMFDFHAFKREDFSAGIQDIIFNLLLLFIFPLYILFILIFVPQLFLFIFVITYLYYTIMNFGQFVIVVLLSERPGREALFLLYSPLFFAYSLFLRGVRIFAYILEFCKSDFLKDGFFPETVWKNMPEYW